MTGLILGLRPANERQGNVVSHWLGAKQSALCDRDIPEEGLLNKVSPFRYFPVLDLPKTLVICVISIWYLTGDT